MRYGVHLPLHPFHKYIFGKLGCTVGQVSPLLLQVLSTMFTLWKLAELDYPTHNEVLFYFDVAYLTKKGCGGTFSLQHRRRSSLGLTDFASSCPDWRGEHFFASGWSSFANGRVPSRFRARVTCQYALSATEKQRCHRVEKGFSERFKSVYLFADYRIMEMTGLAKTPIGYKNQK